MSYSPTQFQLTHLLQRMYRKLKVARTSKATGGSASTIVDSKLVNESYLGESNENDYLIDWTAIIVRDSAGAGAAPEGEMNRVSAYNATGTITVPDNWSGTSQVAAGDTYMYISPDFPLYDMIEVVNDALQSEHIGKVPVPDTSLTTVNNQTEYTLPSPLITDDTLLDVEIQGITTDVNDNRYVPVPEWKIIPSGTPGTAGTLVIPQFAAGYKLRLTYLGLHPRVSSYSDNISEYIPPALAVAACVAYALEWYNSQSGGGDKFWTSREDRAWNQLDIAKQLNPIAISARRVQGFPNWQDVDSEIPPEAFFTGHS